ncbi:MAG: flagellar hook capping protein [Bacteroidetes bacterium]|nr:flagellar hook capping protein [Bacteroidota bacterium]
MDIAQVSNSISPTSRKPQNTLGKQDFLNLLVTQMKNQDPLDPMKGTEFAAQLAQFSSLEQLTNLNEVTQQGVNANAYLTQSINNALSATFIGHNVRANTDTFRFTGEGDVTLGYNLAAAADSVKIKIFDTNGKLVKTISGNTSSGDNSLEWDGTNDNGEKIAVGNYSFQVDARDASDNKLSAVQYLVGKVSGVRFKPDGTVFVIDGMEVPIASILEIMKG